MFDLRKNKNIAYALSGGSAYGFAHVGVIKYLEEKGIYPSAITGSSMGAIVGGLYSFGLGAESLYKVAKDFNWIKMLDLFLRPNFEKGGFIDSARIRDFFMSIVGDVYIEELKIPFVATATDIMTGEEIDINEGPLVNAMVASMSIPFAFKPYYYKGRYLVDGGVRNNLPFDLASLFAPKVIAFNVLPVFDVDFKTEQKNKKNMVHEIIKKRGRLEPINKSKYVNKVENKVVEKDKKSRRGDNKTLDNILPNSLAIMNLNRKYKIKTDKNHVLFNINIKDYKMIDFAKALKIAEIGYNYMLDKNDVLLPFMSRK